MNPTVVVPLTLLIVVLAGRGSAQAKPVPAAFQLVTDVDAVVPGEKLTIGLWIVHAPGWHTYWKNPGTVGLATSVKWDLPKGFTAGPLQWQRPQLTKMGVYTVWGYEGRALLLTDITVPKTLATRGGFEVRAAVSFMACSKTCKPGHTKLSLTLPRRDKSKPDGKWRRRFEAVRRRQPRRLPASWKVVATRQGEFYTLTLTPKGRANTKLRTLYFFGVDRLVSSNAPQEFRRSGKRLMLRLRREKFTPGEAKRFRGYLYAADGFLTGGSVRGLAVDEPLSASAKKR